MSESGDVLPRVRPEHWREWANGPAAEARGPSYFDRGFIQSWTGTSTDMPQPAIDHHLIVLHQMGPKRISRSSGTARRVVDAPLHAHSTVQSGSHYHWRTEGPIAFSHLYVEPARFAEIVAENFDRDPQSVQFAECIGRADPYVAQLFDLMIATRNDPDWAVTADYYLDALLLRLATTSTRGAEFPGQARLALTGWTVARVRDFIRSNIAGPISLGDLADVAGYSRYHFVRAFKASTGMSPYAYMLQERVAHGQELLIAGDEPIGAIARQAGFSSHTHFSTRFRATAGLTPAEYRRRHRRRGSGAATTP